MDIDALVSQCADLPIPPTKKHIEDAIVKHVFGMVNSTTENAWKLIQQQRQARAEKTAKTFIPGPEWDVKNPPIEENWFREQLGKCQFDGSKWRDAIRAKLYDRIAEIVEKIKPAAQGTLPVARPAATAALEDKQKWAEDCIRYILENLDLIIDIESKVQNAGQNTINLPLPDPINLPRPDNFPKVGPFHRTVLARRGGAGVGLGVGLVVVFVIAVGVGLACGAGSDSDLDMSDADRRKVQVDAARKAEEEQEKERAKAEAELKKILEAEKTKNTELHNKSKQSYLDLYEKEDKETANKDKQIDTLNDKEDQKKKQRQRKKKRKEDDEEKRKQKNGGYFGYLDRIELLSGNRGWELRVEAVAENTLSDDIFINQFQKMMIAAESPNFPWAQYCLLTVYVREKPSFELGDWINLKVDESQAKPATGTPSDVPDKFDDGLTIMEKMVPMVHFSAGTIDSYFASNWGTIVQTQPQTMKKEVSINILQSAFGTVEGKINMIQRALDRIFPTSPEIPDTTDATTVPSTPTPTVARRALNPSKSKSKTPSVYKPAKVSDIKNIFSPKAQLSNKFQVFDVGQGASGMVNNDVTALFASDFGYGKGTALPDEFCTALIFGHPRIPILLSHWDSDHYRIAKSLAAYGFQEFIYGVTNRPWITPGMIHITGPIAIGLARAINLKKNLYLWPSRSPSIEAGNVQVVQCVGKGGGKPDKNNFGALALILKAESGGDFLYPGDANFECIPNINALDKKLGVLIATHHGSEHSLKPAGGGAVGSTIPQSIDSQSRVIFSYGIGNRYKHDKEQTGPYYTKKGYTAWEPTATLSKGGLDTIEVHLDPLNPKKKARVAEAQAPTQQGSNTASPSPSSSKGLRIEGSKVDIKVPKGILKSNDVNIKISPEVAYADAQFERSITLDGSSNPNSKDEDHLSKYAVTDAYGDIVEYEVCAAKIILQNLPLCIPCRTDNPVAIRLICQDIEIRGGTATWSSVSIPVIRFNVANGAPWGVAAKAGVQGGDGEPGYAGGYLRLFVSRDWVLKSGDGSKTLYDSTAGNRSGMPSPALSVQYRGGRGGDGQKGGHGERGNSYEKRSGHDDVVDNTFNITQNGKTTQVWTYEPAESGGVPGRDGTEGAKGGNAGAPGTISIGSIVYVHEDKLQADSRLSIDLGTGDEQFGKAAVGGQGGDGGAGGRGGYDGIRLIANPKSSNRENPDFMIPSPDATFAPGGAAGPNGPTGESFDTSKVRHADAKLNRYSKEEEIIALMGQRE